MFAVTVDTVMKISLLPFAINPSIGKYYELGYMLFVSLLSLTVSFCQLKNYTALDSKIFIMDNTVYVGAMVFVINNFWISRFRKSDFLSILRRVEEDVLKDDRFVRITHDLLKSYFLRIGVVFACLFTFILSVPVLAAAFTDEKLGSTATLMFPCWFPWKIESIKAYILTMILQVVCGTMLYSFAIGSTLLVTCFMVVINAHCEYFEMLVTEVELRHRLWSKKMAPKNVTIGMIGWPELHGGKDFGTKKQRLSIREVSLDEDLKKILIHHQYVHNLIKDMVKSCSFYAANSLVIFFDATVLLSAIFLEESANTMYRVKILSTELFACLIFALYCYFGEMIIHLNATFRDIMYNTKWFEQTPRLRRFHLLFMELTHYPFKLKAFNMYTIQLSFYAYISKICFSILQFLFKVQDKKLM